MSYFNICNQMVQLKFYRCYYVIINCIYSLFLSNLKVKVMVLKTGVKVTFADTYVAEVTV